MSVLLLDRFILAFILSRELVGFLEDTLRSSDLDVKLGSSGICNRCFNASDDSILSEPNPVTTPEKDARRFPPDAAVIGAVVGGDGLGRLGDLGSDVDAVVVVARRKLCDDVFFSTALPLAVSAVAARRNAGSLDFRVFRLLLLVNFLLESSRAIFRSLDFFRGLGL